MISFEEYLRRKKSLSLSYRGIHLEKCLVYDIWLIDTFKFKRADFRKLFLAYDMSAIPYDKSKRIFATFGMQYRKDHKQAFDFVVEELGDDVSSYNLCDLPECKAINLLTTIQMLFLVLWKTRSWNISFMQQLYMWCVTVRFCNSIDILSKIDFSFVKEYVAMYSATHFENLLTQWFKLNNVETYGLCEGVLVHYEKNIPIDSVSYENIETDHLLTWGVYTRDEFLKAGISNQRIAVGGYPRKHCEIIGMKGLRVYKSVVVLMARGSYHNANVALLEILKSYSNVINIELKLHPVSDIAFYTDFAKKHNMTVIPMEKTIAECIDHDVYDYSIAVNTSAYYEAMMKGLPCLRFCDGSFSLMPGCDDVFSDKKGFEERINWLCDVPREKYQLQVNETLRYSLGVGINDYKRLINGGK